MIKSVFALTTLLAVLFFGPKTFTTDKNDVTLEIQQDEEAGTITVVRSDTKKAILTQNAKENFRPYIHPVIAPDGDGVLTEFSPEHHKHQTGIYWGLTDVNGRNYFTNPGEKYWKRISARVIEKSGTTVKWHTAYNLLDENGNVVMTDIQNWSMQLDSGKYILQLEWKGEAKTDVTIGKYSYGGLFVRMPWKPEVNGEIINTARQQNQKAEGQRSTWIDIGMQVPGRNDKAHIAIFDHPNNRDYPEKWRVDDQMGVGPVPTHDSDWVIKKGETAMLRYEMFIYTGEFNDLELNKAWGKFAEKDPLWASIDLWAVARKEGKDSKFLTPQEAVEAMTLKEGFAANVWASEPMLTQPMAFCWDDKGRMWIAENRDYESRSTGFSNAGNSRILILEDTNHDGTADTKKVFLEGIAFPAALAVGFDGVFIGSPPNLLFVPDRNHDDQADEDDIEVKLTGWGIRDRHETLNSFIWGPDGWLYGCEGFATSSKIRKPKGKGKIYKYNDTFPDNLLEGEGTEINGGVWRYHPIKDKFEVVAHGFSNPWGIDYDAKGQLFITACVIPHLWYVIPGGIYQRQGGQHFNPYTYRDIKTIADHSHRSAHGGARIYQSDAFPAEEKGRIFMANIHEHAVLSDILTRNGSGFTGSHGDDFMMANNAQWVGFSIEIGPDGNLYALDWHDADICGESVLNKETGRVFRIAPEKSLAEDWAGRYTDLNTMSNEQLVQLQTSKSDWHSRRARLILQNRAYKGNLSADNYNQLQKIYQTNANADYRLRAMWTLHITNGFKKDELLSALNDTSEYIRGWAIQMLCEDSSPSATALKKFEQLAKTDSSSVVRLYLASALQRITSADRWQIINRLVQHGEDDNDHNIPKMIWYGTEPLVADNVNRALDLAADSKISMLQKFIARRAVDADKVNEVVSWMGKQQHVYPGMLEGIIDGFEGRIDLVTPPSWKATYTKLQNNSDEHIKQLSLEIAQYFGDNDAANQFFTTLKNKDAPIDKRRKALQTLSAQQRQELIKLLPELIDEDQLRTDAIRAVASFDNENLGKLLMKKYPTFSEQDKQVVIQTMSSRPTYGWIITNALKNNSLEKRDIPANVARQLRRVVGSGFVEVWGPIDQLPSNELAYKKYHAILTEEALQKADLKNGHTVFMRTCGGCHKIFGQGGSIGPDLTGSNRSKIDYLLFNVLEPSADIQEDYKLVVITTRDGRTYSGNITSENDRQITMRIVGQDAVVINKSNIQSRETMPVSMMPSGLFETLTNTEIVDLVGFLSKMK